jgi:RND family efflux transporter MFP subunit
MDASIPRASRAMKKILSAVPLVFGTALANPPAMHPAAGPQALVAAQALVAPQALVAAPVTARSGAAGVAYEGVVEAVRQTIVAAQVPGAVVGLDVRAGDTVQAGQVLVRIDARAADQTAAAGEAQARAARAELEMASRELERQQKLVAQGFISPAALDRVEAHFKSAEAEASAQAANAAAARTQSGFHVVKAPYAGVVSSVSVVVGEMALPGRALVTLYDPAALRVAAAIPQTAVAGRAGPLGARAEIPGVIRGLLQPTRTQLLPTVDAASRTLELRLDLPPTNAMPGMFARAWLPGSTTAPIAGEDRLFVPSNAVVRRSELVAVYVLGRDGKPVLRQVRPGRTEGGEVEILSGVAAGERVALDPQAAARIR